MQILSTLIMCLFIPLLLPLCLVASTNPGNGQSIISLDPIEDNQNASPPRIHAQVDLTAAEQKFIQTHPVIVLGGGASFEPFIIQNSDGIISGYDVDIARLITERTGLTIRFELGRWIDIQKRAENKELDGLSTSGASEKRSKYYSFSEPYFRSSTLVVVKKGNPLEIYDIDDTAGKRIAIQKGNNLFDAVAPNFEPNLEMRYYDSQYELVQALVSDDVDFIVNDDAVFYVAARLGLKSLIEGAFPIGEPFDLVFSLRNDQPMLTEIFNKGLKSITDQEKLKIRKRWFDGEVERAEGRESLFLTPVESAFLVEKSMLRLCGYPQWMPYQGIDSAGLHSGFAADYRAIFSERLGVNLKPVVVRGQVDPLTSLAQGDCDVVILVDDKVADPDLVDLTTPYLSLPYVVATTHDKSFHDDIDKLLEETFAVIKDTPIVALLQHQYPGIKLVEVDTIRNGLMKVISGSVFGFIDSSAVISYFIQTQMTPQIKIAGEIPISLDFSVATTKRYPHLGAIFQKAVGSLSQEDKHKILNHWLAVKYEQGVDYGLAWKIALAALIILTTVVYWNRRLSKEKQLVEISLTAERNATQQNLNFVDMLSHEYRTPLSVLTSSLDLLERKQSDAPNPYLSKQLGRMRKSTDQLRNLFDISLDEKRISDAGIILDKQQIDLLDVVDAAIDFNRNVHPFRDIEIINQPGRRQLMLSADFELLVIALTNLLDNACKYSNNDTVVCVSLIVVKNNVQLILKDQGDGIQLEALEYVFEKYYRSATVGHKAGVGVGLFLVKKIIELHHGKIDVDSIFGQGTTVALKFPLISATQDHA